MKVMEKILYEQARSTIAEISEKASLKEGSILVIGCSTSEIVGSKIGTNSAPEIAALVFKAFYEGCAPLADGTQWHGILYLGLCFGFSDGADSPFVVQ